MYVSFLTPSSPSIHALLASLSVLRAPPKPIVAGTDLTLYLAMSLPMLTFHGDFRDSHFDLKSDAQITQSWQIAREHTSGVFSAACYHLPKYSSRYIRKVPKLYFGDCPSTHRVNPFWRWHSASIDGLFSHSNRFRPVIGSNSPPPAPLVHHAMPSSQF